MPKGKKKTEFKMELKNQTESTVDLHLLGEIVGSEWDRWTNEDMAPETFKQLLEEANGRDLNIFINSGGGSVFGGLSIYNQLKRYSGKKTVYVDGLAGSIASIIAFGGDKLIIPKNAFLMIHKPWITTWGNATELRKTANTLDRIEEGLLSVYEENLLEGVEMATIKAMVSKETWLNGEEASKYFNIEVSDSLEMVASVKGEWFNSYENAPSDILDAEEDSESILSPLVDENTQKENNEEKTANTDDEFSEEEQLNQEIENLLLEIDLI